MQQASPSPADVFLVLAPVGRDAAEIARVLAGMGVSTRAVEDLAALCAALEPDRSAGLAALLLTEEALADGADGLAACLRRQPPWSDLPVVLLTSGGRRRGVEGRWAAFEALGNVTLLSRPLHSETLLSAARAALRARARQHETRSHLEALRLAAETLEARVAERTEALRAETAERIAAQERLSQAQKMEALGQLAGGVAHDFNNASAAVLAGISLLERRYGATLAAAGPAAPKLLAALRDGAERGAEVCRRLLAFSRREVLSTVELDPAEVLGGLAGMFGNALGPGIRVRVEVPACTPPIRADRRQLETVLINLAINARDAMPDGGQVVLAAAAEIVRADGIGHVAGLKPGAYVRLDVVDTGTGMDTEILARATEPFFTTKPQDRGTGLGLSMADGFAVQSGGALRLESEPGRGTTVSLWLPQAEGRETADPKGKERLRALVVDDVPTIRRYLRDLLDGAGWDVTEAAGSTEALARLAGNGAPDLLVADYLMPPGGDGLALIREARLRDPGLPSVLLVGADGSPTFGAAVAGDGVHVLRKPVSPAELSELLAVLQHGRAGTTGRKTDD